MSELMYVPELESGSEQDREIAAMRGFYTDESPLSVVDQDEFLLAEERSEVVIDDSNIDEVCKWLSGGAAFRHPMMPAIIEDARGLVLVY